jgi:hypothetical protein
MDPRSVQRLAAVGSSRGRLASMRRLAFVFTFVTLFGCGCARQESLSGPPPEVVAPSSSSSSPSSPSTSAPPVPSAGPTPSAAASAPAEAQGDDDLIELQFRDASVPPAYHRSYVITVTRTAIRKKVDSYGDVVSDDRAPFTSAAFDALVASVARKGIKARAGGAPAGPGCTGGTGRSLKVRVAKRVVVDGSSARCGGKDAGSLSGDLDAFAAELNRAAPGGLVPSKSTSNSPSPR